MALLLRSCGAPCVSEILNIAFNKKNEVLQYKLPCIIFPFSGLIYRYLLQ